MDYLGNLTTEQANPASQDIDTKSTIEILKIINEADKKVPLVIEKALDSIADVVDDAVKAFRRGGRLFYVGAGTSGRLGVLDASECPPTFGTDPKMIQGIIAGGQEALTRAVEWAEDDEEKGGAAMDEKEVGPNDIVIGITASGHAPYVIGALKRGREQGAVTCAISSNSNSRTFAYADRTILINVGPEIITGSTRMKSGTAQKLVLNMITTAAMIRLGKVYKNFMVDLMPLNSKLINRSIRLIKEVCDCTSEVAEQAFLACDRKPKVAIVSVLLKVSAQEARKLLQQNEEHIGLVLKHAGK
ncbi:N-acetylmuramic acid 6-phosphate etherase [Sediminispirochaeta smaragdinae]|uniref:N-acetylmuramic acid 6-phosphate etherase n=1 Tax=Sediminispirochaeta smaragdinae (strain DSM 11293 / JCM 15392 / SEBR 4228) TaxID=573413 RepID=E1R133_SEDSS|nr:N-acetylmuramic acid 6-phosphate etherase [Sediminispirochaeta smaragdinae]ADK80282.1 glucokinase regulatory-like protein [Sediminispirochaeta smaragdinae DSM 11293]